MKMRWICAVEDQIYTQTDRACRLPSGYVWPTTSIKDAQILIPVLDVRLKPGYNRVAENFPNAKI